MNWENQNNFNATTGNDQKWNAFSFDGIFKFKGFSTVGMYTMAKRTPETGAKFDASGFNVQAGQLFSRRRFEIAVRYAESDPSDLVSNNKQTEIRGAFSYYYARHGLKWQNDFGQVNAIGDLGPGGEGEGVAVAAAVHFLGLLRGKSEVTDI